MPRRLTLLLLVTALSPWVAGSHGVLNVPLEYATLTEAIDALHDGDVIFIQPGVYGEEERTYPGDGLTAGPLLDSVNNITIVGAVPGEVVIDVSDHHHGFAIVGTAAVVSLQGLTIRGSGSKLVSVLDSAAGLSITNCIFECRPGVAAALETTLGGHRVRNCTFMGPGSGSAILSTASGTTINACIFRDFDELILDSALVTTSYSVTYQVGGTLPSGIGVFVADPLFADPAAGDFHLRSVRGRWDGAAFVSDVDSSPCIDAGDPVDSVIAETWPHGARVNMGAFGGSLRASRSPNACAFALCGDCDGDHLIGVTDSLFAAQIGVGLDPGPARGTSEFDSCNVHGPTMPATDAAIDILDSLEIARFSAGLAGVISCCQ